jgi:flotillin
LLATLIPIVVIAVVVIIALFVVVGIFRSMYKVAEPDEALIISGFGIKGDSMTATGGPTGLGFISVTGGGKSVLPGLQTVRTLSLASRTAKLTSTCYTKQGITVKIVGVCMYKIGDTKDLIANAARRFLGQKPEVLDGNIQTVLDGHLRSIIGGLTVEEILQDREKLTGQTRSAADEDLAAMGLVINTLQIIDITDSSDYIANMALPHVAEIEKAARIAKASADQVATVAEQEANANKAAATRDSQVKQADYTAQIASAKATADAQGPLAAAKAQQAVMVEQTKMTGLEADRKTQELEVSVKRPADAEAYAITVKANANKAATIAEAEAAAQQTVLEADAKAKATVAIGQGDADAAQARGIGEAAAIAAKGKAEGEAISAKVLAEASGIKANNEAMATNKDAIIELKLAELMPDIVKQAASAYSNIKNLTMLDGAEGMNRGMSSIIGLASTVLPQIKDAYMAAKATALAGTPHTDK